MINNARRAVVLAGVLGLLAGSQAFSASAGQGAGSATGTSATARTTVVHVSGRQVPVHPNKGEYKMRGDLVGKWLVIPGETLHKSPTLFIQSGHERFNGCLDKDRNGTCEVGEPSGVMRFAYLYWASFDSDGNLLRGQCVHPVTGGDGSFTGARGVLRMVDRPVGGGEVRTTYRGRVVLAGR
jgi:hypothetical protein